MITTGEPIYVSSSNLSYVTYYPESEVLVVGFHGGGVYSYSSVPESTVEALLSASSKGSYFYYNIRNSFSWSKIA